MPQGDLNVANQSGAAFRADMNNQLLALGTNQSGSSPPSTTYAYQFWADTTAGLLKMRNGANNDWITVGSLVTANLGLLSAGGTILAANGSAGSPGFSFSSDTNTGVFRIGEDTLGFSAGGFEQARIVGGGYFRMASGTNGIQFGGDTADSSALKDYEQGSWSPAWSFTSGSVTVNAQSPIYVKIGRLVIAEVRIFTTAISSPSGTAEITGLPFAPSASTFGSVVIGEISGWGTDMPNLKASVSSTSRISFLKQASNAANSNLAGSDFTTGGSNNLIRVTAIYQSA